MIIEHQFVECKIQFINKVYKERFSTYLYYHWIVKHVVSQLANNKNGKESLQGMCHNGLFSFQPSIYLVKSKYVEKMLLWKCVLINGGLHRKLSLSCEIGAHMNN